MDETRRIGLVSDGRDGWIIEVLSFRQSKIVVGNLGYL